MEYIIVMPEIHYMKRLSILLVLSAINTVAAAQTRLNIYAGAAFAKGSYGGNWKNSFNTKANTGWAFGSGVEIPLSKKLILHTNAEAASKKFTYTSGVPSPVQFKRTEQCSYIGLKSALHVSLVTKNNVTITAGAGIFGNAAVKGYYREKSTDPSQPYYSPKRSLKIGNSNGSDYKKIDAGISLQTYARYKNINLIMAYDASIINNKPPYTYYVDPMGMPMVSSTVNRKWHSLYIALGYSFLLNKKR